MAFAINLACTSLVMLCMWKELVGFRYVLDRELLRRMLHYSFPILILGIAGILNQVADKIIFRLFILIRRRRPSSWVFMGLPVNSYDNGHADTGFPVCIRAVCFSKSKERIVGKCMPKR